jgi:hypothetical protein
MVRYEIRASGEIEAGILNPAHHMKAGTADVNDAAGKDGTFPAAAQRKVLIIAKLLELEHERLPHRSAPRHRAMA